MTAGVPASKSGAVRTPGPAMDPAAAFTFPPRYEPVRLIGTGTHGCVFQARDILTGEFVALKHVRRTAGVSTGLKEFSAVLSVNHPSVVRCLDFHYLGGGDTCLVYEYVEGGTLRDRMREGEPCDPAEWTACAQDVLEGLDVLHRSSLLHCDLKPENILCQQLPGGKVRYRISDLGISRFSGDHARQGASGAPAGAPGYMAPENFQRTFSPAGDLYSLGVILFELACGTRPFDGDVREIARGHLFGRVPLERITRPEQAELAGWLLQRAPENRPGSAAVALGRLLGLSSTLPRSTAKRPHPAPSQRRTGATQRSNYSLATLCRHHIALSSDGRHLLGSVYDGHIELSDASTGAPLNLFIPCSSGCFQLLPGGGLVTGEPARVVLWNGDYRVPCILQSIEERPRAVAHVAEHATSAWIEGDHVLVRRTGQHAPTNVVDCPTSGLAPRLLTSPGRTHFILIPGTPRPEAVWIDMNGVRCATAQLPGPVVDASVTEFPAVFCAETSRSGSPRLQLVVPGRPGELAPLTFEAMPLFHSFRHDGVVVGMADGNVWLVGPGAETTVLPATSAGGGRQIWDSDRAFVLTVHEAGNHKHVQFETLA